VFWRPFKGSLAQGIDYVDFLLPDLRAVVGVWRADGIGLDRDLERGVVDRFPLVPMASRPCCSAGTWRILVRNVLIIG